MNSSGSMEEEAPATESGRVEDSQIFVKCAIFHPLRTRKPDVRAIGDDREAVK